MKDQAEWLALCYSVPASPSKARVFVWRRLRSLGAQTIRPGLAALPFGGEAMTRLTDLAEKIRSFGGESLLLAMDLIDQEENARLHGRFDAAGRQALQDALAECAPILAQIEKADPAERVQLEKSLHKKLDRLKGRRGNPLSAQLSELERTTESLFGVLRGLPAEFSAMLRGDKGDEQ